jgi:hypothetical protein
MSNPAPAKEHTYVLTSFNIYSEEVKLGDYGPLFSELYVENGFNNNPSILSLREIRNRRLFQVENMKSIYSEPSDLSAGLTELLTSKANVKKLSCIVGNQVFLPACEAYFSEIVETSGAAFYVGGGEDKSSYYYITEMLNSVLLIKEGGYLIMEITEAKSSFLEFIIVYVGQMFKDAYLFRATDARQVFLYYRNMKKINKDEVEQLVALLTHNKRKKKIFDYPNLSLSDDMSKKMQTSLRGLQKQLTAVVKDISTTLGIPEENSDIMGEVLELDDNTGQFSGVMSDKVSYSTIRELAKNEVFSFPYKRFNNFNDEASHPDILFEELITYMGNLKRTSNFPDGIVDFSREKGIDLRMKPSIMPNNEPGVINILNKKEDYNINKLTDYFTEPIRMRAVAKSLGISPEKFWTLNADWCVYALRKAKIPVTGYNLREFIFEKIKEATQFKLTLTTTVLDYFSAILNNSKLRVLDPCSGWGDRLGGAMASSNVASYTGNDINEELQDGYREFIKCYGGRAGTSYTMLVGKAEELSIKEMFDVVFTSPPYFDYEEYTKESNQSIHNRNLEEWKEQFLYPMLSRALDRLVSGGFMIIHITDHKDLKICKDMYNYMRDNPCEFMGCMLAVSKSKIPMWIWKKK